MNRSLIDRGVGRPDVREISVPANELARELGELRVANMVALGAVVGALGVVPLEAVKEAMAAELGAKARANVIALNGQALDQGYALAGPLGA